MINIKNLYLYQSFALHLDEENKRIQKHLAKTYNRVYGARQGWKTVLSDSVFRILYADSSQRIAFAKRLNRLERKWNRTDSTSKANVDSLNAMKVKVAENSMSLSGVLNIMDIKLERANRQLFGPETNCLWQIHKKDTLNMGSSAKVISLLGSERNAIGYYFGETAGQRGFLLFLGILLFIWLFYKRKFLKTTHEADSPLGFLNLHYLNRHPVLSLLASLMCLMPFFDAYAPTSYIAMEYLLLFVVATMIFFRKEKPGFLLNWLLLGTLFVVDILTYLLIEPTLVSRLWLLAVHVCIIICLFLFYKILHKDIPYYKWIKRASIAGIILTSLAVLLNLSGRFSLAGMFGIAGIIAVTQAVILPIFIDTLAEVVLLQLQSSRSKKGYNMPFDCSAIVRRIKMPLGIIALILWLIMVTSNLNIYHSLTNSLVDLLTTTRSLGSINFKLISVIWFFVIIWCAHILQRLISFLFGETGTESEDVTPVSKKQHSRLLITRLLVLICGYLLAITASGLPIDKLTIVLGALGVGIGMGLQNIVNNFVSGIILIFDGSLKIGDEIEINGQSGKVKEIGLRASRLNTSDGAEVIIPNGNILSQNIVNWTYSNDQKRVKIWFTLSAKELDSNIVTEVINETTRDIPHVIPQKKPVIIYNRATPDSCSITLYFWSTIADSETVKSEAMLRLSAAFTARGIEFV